MGEGDDFVPLQSVIEYVIIICTAVKDFNIYKFNLHLTFLYFLDHSRSAFTKSFASEQSRDFTFTALVP